MPVRQEADESSRTGAAAPSAAAAAAATGGPTPLFSAASNTVAALGLQTRSMNVPSVRAFGAARASAAAAGPGASHSRFRFPNRSFYCSTALMCRPSHLSSGAKGYGVLDSRSDQLDCCSARHLVRRSRQLPSRCLALCNSVPLDCYCHNQFPYPIVGWGNSAIYTTFVPSSPFVSTQIT